MYFVTRSRSGFAQSKSGKPCDRLIALRSCASRDITVKIVVPTSGSLDAMGRGYEGMRRYFSSGAPSALWTRECPRGYTARHNKQYRGDAVRRWLIVLSLFPFTFSLDIAAAQAQQYPSKPVRWIVPSSAGGANDVLARIVGAKLTQFWGQQVIVDVRPGAGGIIG